MKQKIWELGEGTGIYVIEDFLSARECAALIKLAKNKGLTSGTFIADPDHKKPAKDVSQLARFERDYSQTVLKIHKRIESLAHFPEEQGEIFKVVCYQKGGHFLPHSDFASRKNPHLKKDSVTGRVAQMLIYLNDVEEGGETLFNNLGIQVMPQKGRALLWYSVLGMSLPKKKGTGLIIPKVLRHNPYAVHQPLPVKKGEKWIAAKFLLDAPLV